MQIMFIKKLSLRVKKPKNVVKFVYKTSSNLDKIKY